MKRREVVAALGGGLLWPVTGRDAQQRAKHPRVGWIWAGRSAGNPIEVAGFQQGLKDLGYIEGQNVDVDYRFAEDRWDRIPDLVAELLELRPDVMVALGTVSAVRNATATIPLSGWPATRSAQGRWSAWRGRAATSPAYR